MANPDSRSRPQVKDLRTYAGRSRSAGNFKNSPYYDKFVFFEKCLNQKFSNKNRCKETSHKHGNTVDSWCATFLKDRGIEDKVTQERTQNKTHGTFSSRDSSFTSKTRTSSTMFLATQQTQPKTSLSVGSFSQINSNNTKLKSCSTSNISNIQLIQDITQEGALIEQSCSRPCVQKQRKDSIVEDTKSEPAVAESPTVTVVKITKSQMASHASPEAAIQPKTSVSSLYSSVCEDQCNVSSIHTQVAYQYPSLDSKLRVNSLPKCDNSSEKHTQHVGTANGTFNHCIQQICDSHENVSTANEGSSSTSIESPSSPARKTSTASIKLIYVNKTETDKKDDKSRKIHVLKTQSSLPLKAAEPSSSPRLNEWLSSVMKHQQEQKTSDSWILPEDEPSTSNLDVPFSQVLNDPNIISCISMDSNSPTPNTRQWSSTGINTDISLAPERVHYLSDPKTIPYIKSMSNDLDAFNDSPSYNLKGSPGPSAHDCSRCCSLQKNRPYYSSHDTSSKLRHNTAVVNRHTHSGGSSCACEDFAEGKPTTVPQNISSSIAASSKPTTHCHEARFAAGNDVKTQKFVSETVGSQITICVTAEDDHQCKSSKAQARSDECCIEDLPDYEKIMEDCERRVDTAERASASRGTYPHYMFPRGNTMLEEGDHSRDLFSPRNSVGSINSDVSAFSYKSSNADSAVDMGPPDDDHEFEYADFLARHQARKIPNVTHKESTADSRENEALSMQDSPKQCFCVGKGAYFENMYTHGASTNRNIQSNPPFPTRSCSQKKQDIYNDSSEFTNQEPLECQDLQHESNDYKSEMVKQSTMKDYQAGRRHSLTKVSHSKELLMSALDNLKCYSTNYDPHESHQLANVELENTSSEVQYVTSQYSYQLKCDENSVTLFEPIHSSDNGRWQTVDQQANQTQYEVYSQKDRPKNHQTIPEFIISDHSDLNVDINDMASPIDFGEAGVNSESPSPSRPPSSIGSSEFDCLDIEGRGMRRSGSLSSLCSIASTCSTCTGPSDSEDSEMPNKKQSSWRKIRSFILWSPFIQVFKKHRYPWIQLAGHQGNFHAGEAGSVLKKLDSREQACFQKLMADTLKDFVPEYRGDVEKNGETYIQLQDLLCSFSQPCVMDVKMGVRTYLEEELQKARKSPSMRKDMYQKMIEVDSTAPTPEEHEHKAVTKPRYMQWRDEMSTSVELGFRVEGIKKSNGNSSKDFKKTKSRESVVDIMKSFIGDNETIVAKYIRRLKELMATQEASEFFMSHEVIGSSLLFVHDMEENVGVWMIDFGKSEPLPNGVQKIDHRNTWLEGNHEDGYLFGLDNLISVLEEVQRSLMSSAV